MTFAFHVTTNATTVQRSEIVVGISDGVKSAPGGPGGYSIGFHVGRSKIVTSADGVHIVKGGRSLSEDTPRRLPLDEKQSIRVMAIVDMTTRRLALAINDNIPVKTGYLMPPTVRPWVWPGGPNVGSVALSEFAIAARPPVSSSLGPHANASRAALGDKAVMRESTPSLEIEVCEAPRGPSPSAALSPTVQTGLSRSGAACGRLVAREHW